MITGNVVSAIGWLLVGLAGLAVFPAIVALGLQEHALAGAFIMSIAVFAAIGCVTLISFIGHRKHATPRDGLVLSVVVWPVVGVAAALPFYFSGYGLTPSGAFFEALAAITTTGFTKLSDPAAATQSLFLWRSLLHWFGGIGAIVLAIGVITTMGQRALPLERPQFAPLGSVEGELHLSSWLWLNGWRVFRVYALITLITYLVFLVEGLAPLPAICLAMSAISTAGVAPVAGGELSASYPVQMALFVAMLVGAANFLALTGPLKQVGRRFFNDPEMRLLFALLAVLAIVFACYRVWSVLLADQSIGIGDIGRQLWFGLFDGASLLSTTGWSATPGEVRELPVSLVVPVVMLGGAAIASAGGLKLIRFLVLFVFAGRELNRLTHPNGIVRMRINKQIVEDSAIDAVWPYFAALLVSIGLATAFVALAGHDFVTSLAYATAALTNSGPMVNMVSGVSADINSMGTAEHWVLMLGMIMGRIEILVLFTLFNAAYWR